MSEAFVLADSQKHALDVIVSGRNVLLQGPAGTGKSVVVERAVCALHEARKQVAVVAPTAAAAFLVGGFTLHKLLSPMPQYQTIAQLNSGVDQWLRTQVAFDGAPNTKNQRRQQRHLAFTTISTIILDETSMLRPDLLYVLDRVARTIRRRETEPFGGIQIVLVGDLAQLPPVPLRSGPDGAARGPELFFFERAHEDMYNAFETGNFTCITLDRVFRQTDTVFLDILTNARSAVPFDDWSGECQAAFLERCVEPPADQVVTCMNVTNRDVDESNRRHLQQLPGEEFAYEPKFFVSKAGITMRHHGRELTEENRKKYKLSPSLANVMETALNELNEARVRVGAVVMISHNVPDAPHLYRGLVGTVTYANELYVLVQFPHAVERVEPIEVRQSDPDSTFADESQTKDHVLTRFMPLRLAWSVTVHRAQGATINAARVTLEPEMMPGAAYTALSRLRSLNGLFIRLTSARSLETCFRQSVGMARFERWVKKRSRSQAAAQ